MSGRLNPKDDVRLGMHPLQLLHPRYKFRQPFMVVFKNALFTKLNSSKVRRSRYMRLLGDVCSHNQGTFGNLLNSLILLLLHLILHVSVLLN